MNQRYLYFNVSNPTRKPIWFSEFGFFFCHFYSFVEMNTGEDMRIVKPRKISLPCKTDHSQWRTFVLQNNYIHISQWNLSGAILSYFLFCITKSQELFTLRARLIHQQGFPSICNGTFEVVVFQLTLHFKHEMIKNCKDLAINLNKEEFKLTVFELSVHDL